MPPSPFSASAPLALGSYQPAVNITNESSTAVFNSNIFSQVHTGSTPIGSAPLVTEPIAEPSGLDRYSPSLQAPAVQVLQQSVPQRYAELLPPSTLSTIPDRLGEGHAEQHSSYYNHIPSSLESALNLSTTPLSQTYAVPNTQPSSETQTAGVLPSVSQNSTQPSSLVQPTIGLLSDWQRNVLQNSRAESRRITLEAEADSSSYPVTKRRRHESM